MVGWLGLGGGGWGGRGGVSVCVCVCVCVWLGGGGGGALAVFVCLLHGIGFMLFIAKVRAEPWVRTPERFRAGLYSVTAFSVDS